MQPNLLLADIEAKPHRLAAFGAQLDSQLVNGIDLRRVERVIFTGLGSSRFAGLDAARELRRRGLVAWCDYSSTDLGHLSSDVLLVAISASGATPETLQAARQHGAAQLLAITNHPESPLGECAHAVIPLHAGPEASGAVTSSMIHTALALRLVNDLVSGVRRDLHRVALQAAEAIDHLLQQRAEWLPDVANLLDSPDGLNFITGAHRWAAAAQSALLIRETARRPSTACEAADWAHIDVYLTKTKDYRAVLLGPSPFADSVFEWTLPRRSTILSFGAYDRRASQVLRFPYDSSSEVAPLVDTLLAELVGWTWMRATYSQAEF